MLDGFARSLRSLREEMALRDGATEERPGGGQETKGGQDGKPPTANPGGSTHNSQDVEARTRTSHRGPDVVYVEGGPWLETVRLEM